MVGTMGNKLTDLEINLAQKILRQQFHVNGLDLTLYQSKQNCRLNPVAITNWLQIIHCRDRNHWILASAIGCEIGTVKIYDSLFRKLDDSTKQIIYKYLPNDTRIKMVGTTEKQHGGEDYGVFSIAFATSLALGKDPTTQRVLQTKI